MWHKSIDISELVGKILTDIENNGKEIIFTTISGDKYKMYHEQNCCESVSVDDINGDLNDLLNSPITLADESSNSGEEDWNHFTWTFYRLATVKGYVNIKWYGTSNGYYSESISFVKL